MRRFAPLIKKHLTQAQCAELLEHSLSFQKDLERCRCSPSIENFYHICRTLDISADDCIFQDSHDRTDSTYQALLRLLSLWSKGPVCPGSYGFRPCRKRCLCYLSWYRKQTNVVCKKQKSQQFRLVFVPLAFLCHVLWKLCFHCSFYLFVLSGLLP